jgi:hypothetical protein
VAAGDILKLNCAAARFGAASATLLIQAQRHKDKDTRLKDKDTRSEPEPKIEPELSIND